MNAKKLVHIVHATTFEPMTDDHESFGVAVYANPEIGHVYFDGEDYSTILDGDNIEVHLIGNSADDVLESWFYDLSHTVKRKLTSDERCARRKRTRDAVFSPTMVFIEELMRDSNIAFSTAMLRWRIINHEAKWVKEFKALRMIDQYQVIGRVLNAYVQDKVVNKVYQNNPNREEISSKMYRWVK